MNSLKEIDAPCYGDSCAMLEKSSQLDYAAQWDESKHPRADDGKFGHGGGGAATAEPPADRGETNTGPATPAAEQTTEAPADLSAIQQQPFKADLTNISRQYPPANPDGKDTQSRYQLPDGSYTPERQRLHESIIGKALQGVTPSAHPTVYMMGGGTASGKSTMIRGGFVALPKNSVHVDSDEIKGQLPEYQAMLAAGDEVAAGYAHEESSYLAKQIMARSIASGLDAVMDGTGDSGIEKLRKKVAGWRAKGHKVIANYATVPTETALQWAKKRGEETGRVVGPPFIVKNHKTVSQIVPQAIQEGLFDELKLFDNSSGQSQLVASSRGKKSQIHNQELWNSFVQKGR